MAKFGLDFFDIVLGRQSPELVFPRDFPYVVAELDREKEEEDAIASIRYAIVSIFLTAA